MFKNQLLLVVGFKNDGVFVKTFDLSDQLYATDQENGDGRFIAAHRIEVDILDVLGRRFVFHKELPKN